MAEGRQQTWSYYDIMVIGKTGVGKSTTANKLLDVDDGKSNYVYTHEPRRRSGAIKQWGSHYAQRTAKSPSDRLTGDGATDSVTKHCQLLSNEGQSFVSSTFRVLRIARPRKRWVSWKEIFRCFAGSYGLNKSTISRFGESCIFLPIRRSLLEVVRMSRLCWHSLRYSSSPR